MARDRRFVALHRGGSLEPASHRLLASWAADCAAHVLPLFTRTYPDDERPRLAIEATRAWALGEITVGQAREAAFRAHAAAREASDEVARAVARAAGQAVSTAHMADHSLGPVIYAVKAVKLAAPAQDAQTAAEREHQWQLEHLPEAVRGLVIAALDEGTVLGKWRP
jgi:hypothetical protein